MKEINEKKQITTMWFLTALIVILILIIMGLFIVVTKSNREIARLKEIQFSQMKNRLIQVNEIQSKEDAISIDNEIVTNAFSKIIVDDQTNEAIGVNQIPQINLDFENVKNINKEIYDKYANEDHILLDYNYYLNKNILSLVLNINDINIYYPTFVVYNIDITTGDNISNEELISSKNITSQECEETIKIKFEEVIDEKFNLIRTAENEENKKLEENIKTNTLSSENCNNQIPMFLNEKNKINVIGYIYSIAGAKAYYQIINLDI